MLASTLLYGMISATPLEDPLRWGPYLGAVFSVNVGLTVAKMDIVRRMLRDAVALFT